MRNLISLFELNNLTHFFCQIKMESENQHSGNALLRSEKSSNELKLIVL